MLEELFVDVPLFEEYVELLEEYVLVFHMEEEWHVG